MNTAHKQLILAKVYARDNISELVRDYKELQETGKRPSTTAYDKLLHMCMVLDAQSHMAIANSILIDAALTYITELEKKVNI